ncbi:MAG: bifunctional UDP-3-O-[3-hydroxymyristoyl] N-acetylglucosamine deacetylase/3-hydroxyacyl-ACP dehydratase [Candidatus Omnitrophota bacterium]
MELQRTIKSRVSIKGIGLQTGKEITLTLLPAPANSGISFRRTDIKDSELIPARASKVVEPQAKPRRTTIGSNGSEIQTVEHILAALAGVAVDNVIIEVDGGEIPGLDGSAKPYVELIKKAGIIQQDAPKKYLVVKEPLWVEDGDSSVAVFPSDSFRISYTLRYDNTKIGSQYASFAINEKIFESEIAPSRTFCLASEVNGLKALGLGKGANYENTLVVSEDGIVQNKLRFEDEFVRHKISDLIGDLYLLGAPLKAHVVAIKSGHALNIKMLNRLNQYMTRQSQAAIISPSKEVKKGFPLNVEDIKGILPHREPFLFVDEILELEEDKRAVGIKHVLENEYYFKGHFPGKPVMPGVLIMEAMAQVAGILMLYKKENRGKLAFFMAMNEAKFRRTVLPGDTLRLVVDIVRIKTKTGVVKGGAYVDGKLAAEGEFVFTLVDR